VHNVPVGTLERFCWNTVEISENSENHLRAIVGGREVAGVDGLSDRAEKVAEKTQGEGKAAKSGARGWQSGLGSANYIDLRDKGECPCLSLSFLSSGELQRVSLHGADWRPTSLPARARRIIG
jgi:hypothetical protein